jgi:hypothetical protein
VFTHTVLLVTSCTVQYGFERYLAWNSAGNGTVMQAPSFIPAAAAAPGGSTAEPTQAWCHTSLLAVDVASPRVVRVGSTTPALPSAPVLITYARGLTLGATPSLKLQGAVAGVHVAVLWGAAAATRCADGAPASQCVTLLTPTAPLVLQTTETATGGGSLQAPVTAPRTWQLWSIAPLLPGGFALLGELSKAVRVSPIRFTFIAAAADAAGFSAGLRLAPNETVAVSVLVPALPIQPASALLKSQALNASVETVEVQGNSSGGTAVIVCSTAGGPGARRCRVQ